MKFNKKILALSILGVTVISGISIQNNSSYALNNLNQSIELSNKESIESILSSDDYDSIKKIEEDSKGNPVGSELIDTKNKNSLIDGLYVMDYKEGWVLGKDRGFIKSLVVPSGATGAFSIAETKGFETKISSQISASFGPDFIKATVKAGYGNSVGESKSIDVYQNTIANNGKNLFVKAQAVYRKFDVLKVKNGNITDKSTSYQPVSFVLRQLEFAEGEKVVQSKLYESIDKNILGDPGYNIKQVINPNTEFETIKYNFGDKNPDYLGTQRRRSPIPVGVNFTVKYSGRYEISDSIVGYGWAGKPRKSGVGLQVYKLNDDNEKGVELVASKAHNLTEVSYNEYTAPPLVVPNLQAGEKYVLVINEGEHSKFFTPSKLFTPDEYTPEDVSYNIRIKR